jgi:uncharacterized protein (DUF924 family)
MPHTPSLNQVLSFWFEESSAADWWKKDNTFDLLISNRFKDLHRQASLGELFVNRHTAQNCLAEIIVLDQFSRNIYRNLPASFAQDGMALVLAQEAVAKGFDLLLNATQRSFLYMPFMHSESLAVHEYAVTLFSQLGNQNMLDFELKHKAIIEKFGRYPHRNHILNRSSSPEELEFLTQEGSGF